MREDTVSPVVQQVGLPRASQEQSHPGEEQMFTNTRLEVIGFEMTSFADSSQMTFSFSFVAKRVNEVIVGNDQLMEI